MAATLSETTPDGRVLSVHSDLRLTATDLKNPIHPDPASWAWGSLHPSKCFRLLAPKGYVSHVISVAKASRNATINFMLKPERGDGRVQAVFWNEPAMRDQIMDYDPLSEPNIVKMDKIIPADRSPNGQPLRVIQRIKLTSYDLRLNTTPKEIPTPHKELQIGEAFIFEGPTEFARKRVGSIITYLKPDLSSRLRTAKISGDGKMSKHLIWCEANTA